MIKSLRNTGSSTADRARFRSSILPGKPAVRQYRHGRCPCGFVPASVFRRIEIGPDDPFRRGGSLDFGNDIDPVRTRLCQCFLKGPKIGSGLGSLHEIGRRNSLFGLGDLGFFVRHDPVQNVNTHHPFSLVNAARASSFPAAAPESMASSASRIPADISVA